jgi:hypothetical protein
MAIQKSPDNLLETWVGVAAIWGAVTGTIALIIQGMQHLADRAKVKLEASMSFASNAVNPRIHLCVQLSVLNEGRRLVRIESAGIIMPNTMLKTFAKPGQPSLSLESSSSCRELFNAKTKNKHLELSADGGKFTFTDDFFPENEAREMFQKQKYGTAFIRLSSGKEFFARFNLMNPDDLPVLG